MKPGDEPGFFIFWLDDGGEEAAETSLLPHQSHRLLDEIGNGAGIVEIENR